MRQFLTLEEAWAETLERVQPVGAEERALADAYGRVLAADVYARTPFPPFDRSALDGYAVRAADVAGATHLAPALLDVIEEVGAGQVPEKVVGPGQAVRIMTGAPMPVGADSIARLEITQRAPVRQDEAAGSTGTVEAQGAAAESEVPLPGDDAAAPSGRSEEVSSRVLVLAEVPRGEAVSLQGEDSPQGTRLLSAGVRIGAAETAVLAANGESNVLVHRRPRVGVLVSGSEVRPLTGELGAGQIRDSNGPMLAALIRDCGGEPMLYGGVGDDLEATLSLLRQMAEECDLLLTTGGVSVGDYDLMRDAYLQAGGEIRFWKVTIRPGTPIVYAELSGKPVWGLSGNPAAAFVNFVMLVQPQLRKLAGDAQPEHRPLRALLHTQIETRPIGLDRLLRASLTVKEGILLAEVPSHGQKAAILTSLIGIPGLVRIPAKTDVTHGMQVDVYLLATGAFGR